MQQRNKSWLVALAMIVLICSTTACGQDSGPGAARTENASPAASAAAKGPAALRDFNQQIIAEFRANRGKVGGQYADVPLLLLTTTGAQSSQRRTTPLAYTKDGDRFVVIASFGGSPKHPAWYHNLMAYPEADVEVGSDHFRVLATVTTGEERERLFNRQAKQMPIFAQYQKKTTRQLPVITLTRLRLMSGPGGPTSPRP